MRAVIVRRGVAGREIDQSQLFVSTHRRPRIGGRRRIGLAGRWLPGVAGAAHIEGPGELPRDGVESAHNAGRLPPILAVRDPATQNDLATNNGRRRGDGVIAARRGGQALEQVDRTLVAEARALLARAQIDGNQARICRGCIDACGTDARRVWNLVIGQAATRLAVRIVRQIGPAPCAGFGVDGEDIVATVTGIDSIADLQRRDFQPSCHAGRVVAERHAPGDFQVLDVGRIELRQRRKALAAGVVAVVKPVTRSDLRRSCRHTSRRHVGLAGLEHRIGIAFLQQGKAGADDEAGNGQEPYRPAVLARQPAVLRLTQFGMRQQQPQAENGRRHQTRRQRPAVEANLPQRPGQGEGQHDAVKPGPLRSAAPQHRAGADDHQPGDQIVPRAPEPDQPAAAYEQDKTDKQKHGGIYIGWTFGGFGHGGTPDGKAGQKAPFRCGDGRCGAIPSPDREAGRFRYRAYGRCTMPGRFCDRDIYR